MSPADAPAALSDAAAVLPRDGRAERAPAPAPWRREGVLRGEAATERLGGFLAARLGPGDALLLEGPVGAGKSALARALLRARLGDPEAEVPSPSFTLVQTYGEGAEEAWHADLHRLGGPAEAVELGLPEAFGRALVIVEWPDRLGPLLPAGALRVALAHLPEGEARGVVLSGPALWGERLRGLDGVLG